MTVTTTYVTEGAAMVPVIVTWIDAFADADGWCDVGELATTPRVILTVGWLLGEIVPDHVSVAQSHDIDTVDSVLHIPRSVVRDIVNLEESP